MIRIILFAILASILAVIIIYHKDIISKLKRKKKTAKKPENKTTEPVKEKTSTFKPEDFKPIQRNLDDDRDESVARLFDSEGDFNDNFSNNEQNHNSIGLESLSDEELEERFKNAFKTSPFGKQKQEKTISQTIKELPPEIKALIIDNVLKRKDDI